MKFEERCDLSLSDKYRYRKPKDGETTVSFFLDEGAECETTCTMPLDGVIDEFVVHIFNFGQCHSMALALHDILGWAIVGLYDAYGDSRNTRHLGVTCNGYVGCIGGLRRTDSGRRNVDPSTLRRERKRNFVPLAHDFARHHAPRVAAELLTQMENGMWNPDWWKK
jgi:hypothetical protein